MSDNEGIGLIPVSRLFILIIQVDNLGIDVRCTSLPQWSTLLFLLIFINVHTNFTKHYFFYSHTFLLMIYTFSVMYIAWYHNAIYYWALSIYNYFNLITMPLYHSHTLLSYHCYVMIIITMASMEELKIIYSQKVKLTLMHKCEGVVEK